MSARVCVCVCVCFCECVCVCKCLCLCVRMYHGRFSMSICEMESKERSFVMSDFVSVNCKCGSVSCDVLRAAVTWTR